MAKRLAICVGVNTYQNKPSANLRFARHDAESVATLLDDSSCGGFDVVEKAFDEQATKSHLSSILRALLLDPKRTTDDLVLLYFSGHGALDDGDNLFLAPHDVGFRSDGSVDITTSFHIRELETLLDNTGAGYVLVLLDACHSGASGKLLGRIKYRDSANIVLVGAARYSEKAWEAPEISHGRFTQTLLQSISERPSMGEWITLQHALACVQREMQAAGHEQRIEVSSHIVDQSIPLFKNPSFSLISDELVERTKRLCRVSSLIVLPSQPDRAYPGTFIVREPRSFNRYDDTLVVCLDNANLNVRKAHIEQVNALFNGLRVEKRVTSGMLVTRRELPDHLKNSLESRIVGRTTSGLERSLINFDRSLEKLVHEFTEEDPERRTEPPLSKYYVELNAGRRITFTENLHSLLDGVNQLAAEESEAEVQTPFTIEHLKHLFAIEAVRTHIQPLLAWLLREEKTGTVTDMIQQWLEKDNAQSAVILGGYGTGKTTFARKLACELAKDYRSDPNSGGARIPILIPLRRFPAAAPTDIEAAMISHLKQDCGVTNPDFAAFKEMNNAGLLVLIFDGFDEMAVRVTNEVLERNFSELMQFAIQPEAKVLITSRPEAFLSEAEELRILSSNSEVPTGDYPLLQRIELCPLSVEQIDQFLQKRIPLVKKAVESGKDWRYYQDRINSVMGLKELAERPVLLDMTIKTLPILIEAGGEVTRPRLYETYLTGEIERQQREKRRSFLTDKIRRLEMIEQLACHLYAEKRTELTAEEIRTVLESGFTPRQRLTLDSYVHDFIACSFMIREGDHYRFSHLSFMEYLVARTLAREIDTDAPDMMRRFKLAPAVRDFLLESKPASDEKLRDTLWRWIKSTVPGKMPEAAPTVEEAVHLGSNAITLLNHLKESFENADLSGAILQGADLQDAQCKGANFSRSNLEETTWTNADVTAADFSGARLSLPSLVGAVDGGDVIEVATLRRGAAASSRFQGAIFRLPDTYSARSASTKISAKVLFIGNTAYCRAEDLPDLAEIPFGHVFPSDGQLQWFSADHYLQVADRPKNLLEQLQTSRYLEGNIVGPARPTELRHQAALAEVARRIPEAFGDLGTEDRQLLAYVVKASMEAWYTRQRRL